MRAQPTPLSIGKYRIDHILGEGSMGVVYKGYDESIDREVAIKTIHYNLLAGSKKEEYLYRFRKEAQAAARCLHTSILTVFDYGEDVDTPYIVMEYYNGTDLKSYLKDNEITRSDALNITQQLLDGLQYAHLRGIVHRDLKPGNIFIHNGQNVKISDFGVARIDQSDITQTGQLVGTLRYMAPEMLKGHDIDHRTDLYSTGIILYELLILSGSVDLAKGKNSLRVDLKHKDITAIPKSCRSVIRKALAVEPDQRYQTAASFALDLRKLLRLDEFNIAAATDTYTISEELTEVLDNAESLGHIPEPLFTGENNSSETPASAPATEWDAAFLSSLENNLTFYIGPFAHLLIKKRINTVNNKNALVELLAESIPDHNDRHAFIISSIGSLSPSLPILNKSVSSDSHGESGDDLNIEWSLSSDHLKTIESRLAYFIGPLASTIIKKVSTTVISEEELYQRLAQFIPTELEKIEFLKTQKQRTRM